MINTEDDAIMLELADEVCGLDLVSLVEGEEVDPMDFDEVSDEGQVLSLIDLMIDGDVVE